MFSQKNKTFNVDCRIGLKELPGNYVNCIITSPPYWGQRDYEHPDQIGQEPSLDGYIWEIIKVFKECYRVLKSDGTLWLVIGDRYEDNNLIGIPWRVAFALKAARWLLRSDTIWFKPNAKPDGVKSRPTTAHEYIFLFSKSKRYFYNNEAIKVPFKDPDEIAYRQKLRHGKKYAADKKSPYTKNTPIVRDLTNGANRKSVWLVNTKACSDTNYAGFPEQLVETMMIAGCPEKGIVLDPFMGTGMVGKIAKRLNCHYIGFEVNPVTCKNANNLLTKT